MYSWAHLLTSLLVGIGLVPLVSTPLGPAGTVAYAGTVGTLTDLDHFLIARVRTGSWRALRRAVTSPRRAVLHQDELFAAGEVGARRRLASHVAIGTTLVAGLGLVSIGLATVTAVVLAVHVIADALWDRWRRGRA